METGQLSVDLRRRIGRLRHITGFVTTYGQEIDPRLSVFARLWHVKRVVATADRLSGLAESLDGDRIERLAWLHDLNRWPFAHNSEKGFFDQAANVREYFLSRSPVIEPQDIDDLVGIHLKDPAVISAEARIVLFADSLTGVIEDPLFAVCGLNVHPRIIPASVSDMLGFSLLATPGMPPASSWRRSSIAPRIPLWTSSRSSSMSCSARCSMNSSMCIGSTAWMRGRKTSSRSPGR